MTFLAASIATMGGIDARATDDPGLTSSLLSVEAGRTWLNPEDSNWMPLGVGTDNSIKAFTVWDNQLFAGGYFTSAGGSAASPGSRMTSTVAQTAVGFISSASVRLLSGFWQQFKANCALALSGDVNVNGTVTWSGIIYLVNHVFKGCAALCDGGTSSLAAGC